MDQEKSFSAPPEIAAIKREKIRELDVRPILQSGGEPFSKIMAAIADTPVDGALKLRATFKPTPLFHALGKQGWQYWIERGMGDDWVVWFHRAGTAEPMESPDPGGITAAFLQKEHPELQTRLKIEKEVWYLDVKQMSPPEPMELTLAVIEKLPKNSTLIQINERTPQFLFPIVLERGFTYEIIPSQETEVRIKIAHA